MKLIPGHDTIRTIPGLKLHFLRLFYSLKIFGFSEKKILLQCFLQYLFTSNCALSSS